MKNFNFRFVVFEIIDIAVGAVVNIITGSGFSLKNKTNIVFLVVLAILVILHMAFNPFWERQKQKKNIGFVKKAFKDKGGYDAIAEAFIECIKNKDYKSYKRIKKIGKDIDRG